MSKLFIIATPIGNLEDITFRAIRILQNEVDIIFCEDTRQSKKLLDHYTIKIPMKSLHAHSSDKQIQNAVSLLQEGKTIAYMSDSGTPGLSDPGNKLVAAVASYDIPIIPIPGPSALTSIISICGFSGKNISFGGFLSKKPGRRINELHKLKESGSIIVIYESPHRIKKTLQAIKEVFPEGNICIGRELTKIYEEVLRSSILELDINSIVEKGEFVLAISNY